MFQFTRCPSHSLCIQEWMSRYYPRRVSPFGNPRIIALVQLPEAYRRFRVLHRQLVPRHSSCALSSLNIRVTCSVPLTHRLLTTMQLSKCFRHQWAPVRAEPSPVNSDDTGSPGLSQGRISRFGHSGSRRVVSGRLGLAALGSKNAAPSASPCRRA